MKITEELWHSTQHIYEAILAHPFLRGLTDGLLRRVSKSLWMRACSLALSASCPHHVRLSGAKSEHSGGPR